MTKKLVTIAIASYNNSQYIERCVDSVINQTYKNIEVLIVDDGSTDDTKAVCEPYHKDNHICFVSKENGGLSSVRQMALDLATGDYICFIDADDYLADTYVESMLQKMLIDKSNVCVCSTEFVNEKGVKLQKESNSFLCKESEKPVRVTPSKHGTDSLFNKLVALHSPLYSVVGEIGYIHVIYKSSAVHRKKKNLIRSYLTISEKTIAECEKIGIRQQMEQYISEKLYAQLYMAYLDVYRETESYRDALSELRAIYSEYKEFVHKHWVKEVGVRQIRTHSVKMFIMMLRWCKPIVPFYVRMRESIK